MEVIIIIVIMIMITISIIIVRTISNNELRPPCAIKLPIAVLLMRPAFSTQIAPQVLGRGIILIDCFLLNS